MILRKIDGKIGYLKFLNIGPSRFEEFGFAQNDAKWKVTEKVDN